jgi:hypothetical protein
MKVNQIKHLAVDIRGSLRQKGKALNRGVESISDFVAACSASHAIDLALETGDPLQVRNVLRTTFGVLGWKWGRNELWLTSAT